MCLGPCKWLRFRCVEGHEVSVSSGTPEKQAGTSWFQGSSESQVVVASKTHPSLVTGIVKAVSTTFIKTAPLSFRAASWQSLSPIVSGQLLFTACLSSSMTSRRHIHHSPQHGLAGSLKPLGNGHFYSRLRGVGATAFCLLEDMCDQILVQSTVTSLAVFYDILDSLYGSHSYVRLFLCGVISVACRTVIFLPHTPRDTEAHLASGFWRSSPPALFLLLSPAHLHMAPPAARPRPISLQALSTHVGTNLRLPDGDEHGSLSFASPWTFLTSLLSLVPLCICFPVDWLWALAAFASHTTGRQDSAMSLGL